MHAYTIDDLAVGMERSTLHDIIFRVGGDSTAVLLRFSSAFCAGIRCSVDGRTWIFADRNFEVSISFPQVSALSLRDRFKV